MVNITGGTKLISMVCSQFFSRDDNQLYYLPLGQNTLIKIYPHIRSLPVNYRVCVREYLQAQGMSYTSQPPDKIMSFEFLKRVFKEFRKHNYSPSQMADLRDNEYKAFFTGGWFEQFVFHRLSQELNLSKDQIEYGLLVNNFTEAHRAGNDNELDIVFIHENVLHIVEAKVSIGEKAINKKNLDNILYKLSAINRNFGIQSWPSVITLADLTKEPDSFHMDLARKMKLLGIKTILDRRHFVSSSDNKLNLLLN